MREFFKPWRRKIGVMMLMLACVFMGGWVRSRSIYDGVGIPVKSQAHFIISRNGALLWAKNWDTNGGGTCASMRFNWNSIKSVKVQYEPEPQSGEYEWKVDWGGFDFYKIHFRRQSSFGWQIPYWSIVIPLTLLSAYLLLTKPRPAKKAGT